MKRIFILIAVIFLSAVNADAQLLMEKSRVRLTVTPGETVIDSIILHNTGSVEADIKVYWQDFVYVPPFEGKKKFVQPGSTDYSMGDWISYSPQLLTLPPQGKREINFTLKVPEDAKGGYYGVLFFEQALGNTVTSTGVNVITRLGSLFFIETVNADKSARIDNVRFEGKFLKGDYANLGDIFQFPKGIYYLMSEEGVVVDRGEIDKIYLIPNNSKEFEVYISDDVDNGNYTMVVTFDLNDGDSIVKEVDFTKTGSGQFNINELRD